MKAAKAMKEGDHLIEFEILQVGTFSIGHNVFKYSDPPDFYSEKEKKTHIKEHAKMDKYTVWCNGRGISSTNSFEEGLQIIRDYVNRWLNSRIEDLTETLGGLINTRNIIRGKNKSGWLYDYKK